SPSDEVEQSAPTLMNRGLRVAISSSFVLRLAGASTGFLLSTYLARVVHADANVIGLLAAVYFATELLLAPVFGALSDLRGRKPFLVFGPLAGAVAVQIFPLTTAIVILAVGRLLEGLASAANVPGTLGYLADATSGKGPDAARARGRVMGMYEISFVVGLAGGNVLGGQLWKYLEVNGFRLVSLVYLTAAALLFFFVKETLPASTRKHHALSRMAVQESAHPLRALLKSRLHQYAELLKVPALHSFVPAWLAINAIVGLWFTHINPLLQRNQKSSQLLVGHFTTEQASFVLTGFGLIFMLGIFLWSRLYGRFGRTDMMLASISGVFLVAATLLAINNNVLPGPWGQWPLIPLLVIGVLLESGFTPVALAYLADISETREEHRGTVMGLYSVFLGVGQLVGGASGGPFIEWAGFNGLLVGTVLLGAIAGAAILWLRAKYKV
ncbi:MAG: MFS transporter, partial [Chloroflexota bacterium]|nr:MFS transporter [Chloroflexota bacterium]